MRILCWNLFHGRSEPPASRSLLEPFAAQIASWAWDLALLQEVPPWWPERLAAAADADARTALTSRNALLPVRRAIAERRPDLIASNGGGANALLVRREAIVADRRLVLRRWPERRVAQLARLAGGLTVVDTHLSTATGRDHENRNRARAELGVLWAAALAEAGGGPLLLGGDLNLFDPAAPAAALRAGHAVDHVFLAGGASLERISCDPPHLAVGGHAVRLSDHRPLMVEASV